MRGGAAGTLRVGLLVLGIALSVAACSTQDRGGVATAGGDSVATTSTTPSHGDPLKFAQCMRDNGIENWPDPPADGGPSRSGGGGPARVIAPEGVDPMLVQQTMQKCKEYLPDGGEGPNRGGSGEALLAFAQCMRENGFPEFPDPPAGGGNFGIPRDIDPNSAEFQAAQAACREHLDGGQGRPGSGE